MRIVAVADTHTFESDLGSIPEGDVFVHAGDMLRGGTLDELAPVAAWIRALPHAHKVIVPGNHDWCFIRGPDEARRLLGDAICLVDEAASIEGVRFWGSPWQPAYNDWAYNLERGAALAAKWALIPNDCDVLITHGPPRGYGDEGPTFGRAGCDDLRARVLEVKPALHMFGHIHQDGGVWTTEATSFANVTTWECERAATVLDLDVSTRRVAAISVPPPR